jgi:hypothetical protein
MNLERVADPVEYINSIHLHDARIDRVDLDVFGQTLELTLHDLYANWNGLPEYRGPRPCVLIFKAVDVVHFDLGLEQGIWISDSDVTCIGQQPERYSFELDLSMSGGTRGQTSRSVVIMFGSLEIRDLERE